MDEEYTPEVKKSLIKNWMNDAYIFRVVSGSYRVGFTFNNKDQLRITFYFEDSDHFVREEILELSNVDLSFEIERHKELMIITSELDAFEEGFNRFQLQEF